MAELADIVVLGEVESQSELDRAIDFLTNFGLTVFPKHVSTNEALLMPGSVLQQDSQDRYLVTCYENDFEQYKFFFGRCSAGYNSGADRVETGKRKIAPALWDIHRLPSCKQHESKLAAYQSALQFYARESNYEHTVILRYDYNDGFHTKTTPVHKDGGATARKALHGA